MATRGQPTKLNPETHKIIIEAVRDGVPLKFAAMKAGVTYDSLRNWVKRGGKETEGPFFDFFHAFKKAEGEAVARNVDLIQTAALTTWQAAAWWLERRYPEEFGAMRHELATLKKQVAALIKTQGVPGGVGVGDRGAGTPATEPTDRAAVE